MGLARAGKSCAQGECPRTFVASFSLGNNFLLCACGFSARVINAPRFPILCTKVFVRYDDDGLHHHEKSKRRYNQVFNRKLSISRTRNDPTFAVPAREPCLFEYPNFLSTFYGKINTQYIVPHETCVTSREWIIRSNTE